MATKDSKYWNRRFSTLENSLHNEGLSCYAEIEQQYRRAEHEIETKMRSWYNRFAENNEISISDARRLLKSNELEEFKWTVQDYIKAGEENALDGRWMKELENASAKYHISRLESLELELQQSLEVMFGNQLDSLDAAMRKVYTDGYYHTAFEIQKGWGVGWDFAQLDERKINKVIHKPWAVDGRDFSERIWENREKLVNELNQTLVQNMVLGEDPQKAINRISEKMEVSKRNAGRLVMTEEAYFASVSQADCFRELDVEQYQIIVTFDKETCDTCGDMDGRVFKMSEREVGATAPPFHPNCRCTTIPYFDEWYGLDRERAAKDENGQTYKVPADMTYKQWQNKSTEVHDAETNSESVKPVSDKAPSALLETLRTRNIEYVEVKDLPEELTSDQIIARVGGGDKTKGSCSSLAFTYSGNRAGYDVLDFRNGTSRQFFANDGTIINMANLDGVTSKIVKTKDEIKTAISMLNELPYSDKEYYFAVGRHAAVIRKTKDTGLQYLELQTENQNGWYPLSTERMKTRFKATHSRTLFGDKIESNVELIDLDSLNQNPEFREILGYINTSESAQVKGAGGGVK